ncbi:hypothetical protein SSX86_001615 [Deinandra increscens subsp. villosa]|uniref:Uncharacterized protein n=1 Tax=Deinandra increscens subsp. villosa TaxID=3103831 RepID=A0AAP0DV61_9ASTR
MAFVLKSVPLSFLLLLICFLLLLQLSGGINNNGSAIKGFKEIRNRKLLVVNGLEAKEAVFSVASGKKSTKVEEEGWGWELRAAPLGPDPLHHHGADPTKPRTP